MTSFGGDFECPDDFIKEEVLGQLCLEDVDDDSELWLIRMPSDIALSSLDKKKIFLSDEYSNTFQTESGKVIECFIDNAEIPNLCAVLPQKSDKKLHEVKKVFKGSILVTEGLGLTEQQVKCELQDNGVNDSASSITQPKKKSKKKESKTCDDLYDTEGENMDISQTKRQSRKRSAFRREIKNDPLSSDRDEFPYCDSQI